MFLIIFLGLIAKIALVSGEHLDGTGDVKYFDRFKVGIIILIWGLRKIAFKTASFVYISFVFPLTNSQMSLLNCARLSNRIIYGYLLNIDLKIPLVFYLK